LELGILGYVEPAYPRFDLTYDEKLALLRKQRGRRISPCPDTPMDVDLGANSRYRTYKFARGVYAELRTMPTPTSNTHTQQLDFVQLPSENMGSALRYWCHSSLQSDIDDFAIDPVLDLLVLLRIDVQRLASAGDHMEGVFVIQLHSLESGTAHPAALFPELSWVKDVGYDVSWLYEIYICGKVLAITFYPWGYSQGTLVVWDWTSGNVLLVRYSLADSVCAYGTDLFFFQSLTSDDVSHRSLTVVQDRFVIVPRDVYEARSSCPLIGYLDVYDLRQASSTALVHNPGPVVALQLPRLKQDNTCNLVKNDTTSFRCLAPAVSQAHCPSLCPPSPKLYELDSKRGQVCLISVNVSIRAGLGSSRGNVTGVLCIPSSVFSSVLLSHPLGSSNNPVIPWELWGKETTWLSVSVSAVIGRHTPYASSLTTTIETRLPGSIVLWDFSPLRLWLNTTAANGEKDQTSTSDDTVDNNKRTFADNYLKDLFSSGHTKSSRPFLRNTVKLREHLTPNHSVLISDEHSKYTSRDW
jgi:hypothetical protein